MDEAEAAYREALAIEEPRLDPNDPRLAITLSNFARVHWKRKDFDQAEPLCLRAADIIKAAHGAESADYGMSLSSLGALYGEWANKSGQASRRAQEEDYQGRALIVTRAARGPRHPEMATRHSNLAVMKANRSDWPGAAAEAERAVAIMLSLDLAQHPDTQRRVANLAHFWQQSGQSDKATRLRRGDVSDLLPVIAQIEAEHHAWVAADTATPKMRRFGPPSPFGPSQDDMAEMARALAEAGVDMEELMRRVQSGELSEEDAAKLATEALARRTG